MAPRRKPPADPLEWLNRAKSNLSRAKADIRLSDVYLEDLCFDAQQAAEKAVKAVLIHLGVRFPYVHDLVELLTLVEENGEVVPTPVKEAGRLTRFAIVSRYPGLTEPVTREEYEKALRIAEVVVEWVDNLLTRKP
ncbi:HEPN domain-containing protein [Acidobacteria bacterium AH-259-G07]|nr:HEPN domain-containing protein [Acidobacteria bacterium AH-259-G07]